MRGVDLSITVAGEGGQPFDLERKYRWTQKKGVLASGQLEGTKPRGERHCTA